MGRPRKGKQALDKQCQIRMSQREWTQVKALAVTWTKNDERGMTFTASDVIRHFLRDGLKKSGRRSA